MKKITKMMLCVMSFITCLALTSCFDADASSYVYDDTYYIYRIGTYPYYDYYRTYPYHHHHTTVIHTNPSRPHGTGHVHPPLDTRPHKPTHHGGTPPVHKPNNRPQGGNVHQPNHGGGTHQPTHRPQPNQGRSFSTPQGSRGGNNSTNHRR